MLQIRKQGPLSTDLASCTITPNVRATNDALEPLGFCFLGPGPPGGGPYRSGETRWSSCRWPNLFRDWRPSDPSWDFCIPPRLSGVHDVLDDRAGLRV